MLLRPPTSNQRPKYDFSEAGLSLVFLQGAGYVPQGGREGGSAHVGLKGGRGSPLILPATWFSEEVKRCRWYLYTTSMLKIEDPGSPFMLCLGPGPPLLLHLTRADLIWPYAGDTVWDNFYRILSRRGIIFTPHSVGVE